MNYKYFGKRKKKKNFRTKNLNLARVIRNEAKGNKSASGIREARKRRNDEKDTKRRRDREKERNREREREEKERNNDRPTCYSTCT